MNPLSHPNKPLRIVIDAYRLEEYQQAAQATSKRVEILAQSGEEWTVTGGGSYVLPEDKVGIAIHGSGDLSDFWKVVRQECL